MAKFYGVIGYAVSVETAPGIWEEKMKEVEYIGDVIRTSRRFSGSGKVNDDITITNQISIIADPFANNNFHAMKYVIYMGAKWKITDVTVEYPRLILSVGGVFNE